MGTLLAMALFIVAAIVVVKIAINVLAVIVAIVKAFWKPLAFYLACALSAFFSYKIGLHDKFSISTFDKVACVVFVILSPLFLKNISKSNRKKK